MSHQQRRSSGTERKSTQQAARDLDGGTSNAEANDRIQVQSRAREGVAGSGSEFPFAGHLSSLMGHDVGALTAHIGGSTGAACEELDARGYALGDQVAFRESPDLWTAAHEAAHCIQQGAGIGVAGGVGTSGDAGERLADTVADQVSSGKSAAGLLPSRAATSSAGGASAVQFYKEETDASGKKTRVSDDGDMRVGQGERTYPDGSRAQWGTHDFSTRDDVSDWNDELDDVDSVIELSSGPKGPDGFQSVSSENTSTKTSGDNMEIWADCGYSGRDVMGAGNGTGQHDNGRMTAVYNKERDAGFFEKLGKFATTLEWDSAMKVTDQKETAASDPQEMKKEILSDLLGGTPAEAIAAYEAMTPAAREAFDQKAGINRAAAPEVGEGYTMASHGNKVPVANDRDRQHDNDGDGMVDQWNFHWAGVVGRSGGDAVTLENYATGVPDEKNKDWEHQMYGSAPGQTFYDAHKDTKQHGDMPFAFRVRQTDD